MPTFRQDTKIGGMVPMMKTDDINDQAITKDKIRDGNVTAEKLADGAVRTDKLPDGAIKTPKIEDGNITTSKLAEESVVTSKIADQNVTKEKIADQSVDNSKLSPEAVTYDKLKDKAIITEKLNDRAVTTEKIEEKAITNAKIGDSAVDGRTIGEASVEKKHLANDSVATEKLQDSSVTSDKIHTNAVTEEKIDDSAISNPKLADNSVGTSKIKDGNVTNEKVANNTLTIDKFDPELRKSIQAATGLPDNLVEVIQDVDVEVKSLHSKDEDLQSQIADKQQQITANDKDIESLQNRSTQMEQSINNIAVTGGASVANTVTYSNTASGLVSINAQGAIDELAAKNATKAEKAEVTAELEKKFDKESILQESGDAEDKVMSQKAVSDKLSDLDSEIYDLNTAIHGEKFIAPIQVLTGALSSSGSYSAGDDKHHVVADVSSLTGKNLTISGYYVQWGFLKTYKAPNASEWTTGGRIDSSTKDCINEEIPSDAKYIYVYMAESTTIPTFNVTPLQDGIYSEIADINNNLNAINDRIDGVDETVGTINAKLGRLNSSQLCKVQYFQGTFGTASEKLSIDIPCGECIIRYDLTHNITSDKMKDVWRIQYAYLVAYNKETPITINGEWECAFLINGQNDATGGDLHGYEEIQGDLYVFVDGTLKSASSLSDGKYFNDLKIVETTYMYKQDATKVAEHGREYTFNINGILLKQTLKFVESLLLDNCYMMMLPAAKSLTNKYYTDVDFVVNNIASLPIYKDGVKSFSILGNDFKANIIAQNYPELPATLLIHDNGGRAYNKCYLFAAFNKNVSANTKFESSVLYQIAAAPICQETHYADYYPLTQGQTVASNGEPNSSDTYDLVTIILDRNALLWTNWNGGLGYTAIGYNGVRYRSSENNLPSSRNPLSVQANTPVYFSCVPQSMDESEIVVQYT